MVAGLIFLTAACSNQTFKGQGQYVDASGVSRAIVLQYTAQVYHIPFLNADVDYGSISLRAECLTSSLLDSKIDPELGLVFTESTQNFTWVGKQDKIKIGHHLVCAKLENSQAIFTAKAGDSLVLQTFCKAKNSAVPILPANPKGYTLVISAEDEEVSSAPISADSTCPTI